MNEALYPRLAVIGCGLIGSSVVRAARARDAVDQIAVFDGEIGLKGQLVDLRIVRSTEMTLFGELVPELVAV